jgi:SAM-dependent methyltransferase
LSLDEGTPTVHAGHRDSGCASTDRRVDGTGVGAGRDRAGQWPEIARQWQQIGPPLQPRAEDVGFVREAALERGRRPKPPRVLLLGVTPELYRLPWPKGTDFLAVDRTQAMIDVVWPGPSDSVQCADWLAMALPDASRDVVLCDGGLHLLAHPEEQRRLVRSLAGVLSDQGLCILRLYVPPVRRESPDAVLDDLLAGRIPNLNILKLRLWMSLLDSAAEGVELGAVWSAIHEVAPDLEGLASKIGWPAEHVLAINTYRGSTARYHLVTVDQVSEMFCSSPGGFELVDLRVPSYELGEQCPTIVLRRRSNAATA